MTDDEIKENKSRVQDLNRALALMQIGYDRADATTTARKLDGLSDLAFANLLSDIKRRRNGHAPREVAMEKVPDPKDKVQASIRDFIGDFMGIDTEAMQTTKSLPAPGAAADTHASIQDFMADFLAIENELLTPDGDEVA